MNKFDVNKEASMVGKEIFVDRNRATKRKNICVNDEKSRRRSLRKSMSRQDVIFSQHSREHCRENAEISHSKSSTSLSRNMIVIGSWDFVEDERSRCKEGTCIKKITFIEATHDPPSIKSSYTHGSMASFSDTPNSDQQEVEAFLGKEEENERRDRKLHYIIDCSCLDGEISKKFCYQCDPFDGIEYNGDFDIEVKSWRESDFNYDGESVCGSEHFTEIRDEGRDDVAYTSRSSMPPTVFLPSRKSSILEDDGEIVISETAKRGGPQIVHSEEKTTSRISPFQLLSVFRRKKKNKTYVNPFPTVAEIECEGAPDDRFNKSESDSVYGIENLHRVAASLKSSLERYDNNVNR